MDKTALQQVGRSAQVLEHSVQRLVGQLPVPGEPAAVYALRSRVSSDDVKVAAVPLARGGAAWVVYVETAVDVDRLYAQVLRPLQETAVQGTLPPVEGPRLVLPKSAAADTLDAQVQQLLAGRAVVFAPGSVTAVDVQRFPSRPVSEASTEQAIVGSKEGFVEDIHSNIGAVRHRLRDAHLRVETFVVGRRSATMVAMLYLEDVINADLLEQTRHGLAAIDTDFIRTAHDVSSFLFQRTATPTPLVEETERPDSAATAVASGRLCLMVDGSPFVLLVPTTLLHTVQDTEAAVPGPIIAVFVRVLRLIGEIVSVSAGGLYVALLTADSQVLPTSLALAVSGSRNGVPYPVLTETLVMLVVIDVFSEAARQAPGGVGNTLSIVGTLIIGEMAVQARLASSLMMIVVAATALGTFLTLKYPFSFTLRLWKYPIALLAGVAGLFGWMAGLLLMFTHMASLKSAGVPYLSPLGPLNQRTLFQAGIVRSSRVFLRRRPGMWDPRDIVRAPGGREDGGPDGAGEGGS